LRNEFKEKINSDRCKFRRIDNKLSRKAVGILRDYRNNEQTAERR